MRHRREVREPPATEAVNWGAPSVGLGSAVVIEARGILSSISIANNSSAAFRNAIQGSPFIASDATTGQMAIVTICCYIRMLNHHSAPTEASGATETTGAACVPPEAGGIVPGLKPCDDGHRTRRRQSNAPSAGRAQKKRHPKVPFRIRALDPGMKPEPAPVVAESPQYYAAAAVRLDIILLKRGFRGSVRYRSGGSPSDRSLIRNRTRG